MLNSQCILLSDLAVFLKKYNEKVDELKEAGTVEATESIENFVEVAEVVALIQTDGDGDISVLGGGTVACEGSTGQELITGMCCTFQRNTKGF